CASSLMILALVSMADLPGRWCCLLRLQELVISPLQSGDIYASFQFRTLWEADFFGGNKGRPRCPTQVRETLPQQFSFPGSAHSTRVSGRTMRNHLMGAETDAERSI
uniref:Secreted protein n=1 Tax=Hippocampus comes TaxID=109280 RepID=A0A3Q2YDM7_HIPCM